MATRTKPALAGAGDYMEVLRAFPPRPIRSDAEHRRAIEVIDGLIDRPDLSVDEADYLDVLGLIVADYEDALYDRPALSPIERLRYLMEEHGLTQAELARRAGVPVQSLSDILHGKRKVSPRVRARLAECFGCAPSFFA